jgi:hypothetical protein
MQLGRLSVLMLLLLGWMWLSPAPAQPQTTTAPNVLPQILEFDRKLCPVCKASEQVIVAVTNQYPGQFEVRRLYIDEADSVFRRWPSCPPRCS